MEEMTRRPDFICDPVPGNFRQRFEGRKGKNRSLTVLIVVLFLFAVSVLDAILFAAGPDGDRYAALGGSRGYAFLTALLKGVLSTAIFTILPLAGAVKRHSSMTGKLYAAKIRKYETGWFAGFFAADCLVTEDKKGHRSTWYYNDIVSVEEDGGSFRVRGEGGELLIPKMYLKRDAVRSVRNHLRRYCADVYRQDFVEEEEGISLVLSGQEASEDAAHRQREIHGDYLDYVKNSTSFYYTETRLWVIGACAAYLIRCALSGSGGLSRIAGIGILVILLCIPVLTGLKNMAARRTLRARDRRMEAGIPTELKIGKGGVLLRSGQMDEGGKLQTGSLYQLGDTDVVLTQKDIREMQLAKGAISAGIQLLAERLGIQLSDIQRVCIAGAFGNYMDPNSACDIGLIPPELRSKVIPVGNAAGEGAKMVLQDQAAWDRAERLARKAEFLELASLPQFQDAFIDNLEFPDWEENGTC